MSKEHKPTLIYGGRDDENWRKARVIRALGSLGEKSIPPVRWADDYKGCFYVGVDFEAKGFEDYHIVDAMFKLKAAWELQGEPCGVIYNALHYPERTMDTESINYIDWITRKIYSPEQSLEELRALDFWSIAW